MLFRAFLALAVVLSFHVSPAYAATETSADSERDDYDFSWLDPDKKIYVVQNRKYLKGNHLELALSGNVGFGPKFNSVKGGLGRGTYYFNEHFGMSGFYGFESNSYNGTFSLLQSQFNIQPSVRELKSYIGGSVMWLPFYGKMNMFNQILYIDWHLEAGVDSCSTTIDLNTHANQASIPATGTYTGFHWGTGWKFFITRNWGARLDFLAIYYSAPVGLNGALTSTNNNYDNYFVNLGVSYTF
jgi:outer membrane beta-barrel protein